MSHQKSFGDAVLAPRSKFYQGPFGRLCPNLDPYAPPGTEDEQDVFFLDFATKHMVELPGKSPGDIAADPGTIDDLEQKFGSNIPAGYTYFGQFVDHDITLDTTPLTARQVDPDRILNFRTPRLDLDCVYGRGMGDQPYLYDRTDPGKMLVGEVSGTNLPDLPRNHQGRALIADMRNDENSIVSQLQLAFIVAHNTLVDRARVAGAADPFAAARKTLVRLYQWIVWNDFIPRVVIDEVWKCALTLEGKCAGRKAWDMGLSDVYKWKHQPYMPVEFSGAAYRFGHSMVRNSYQTNHPHRGFGVFAPIFDNTGPLDPDDLRGFRPMKAENVIQWDWFLQMASSAGPFPQMARKIDTKLANALVHLHEGPAGEADNVLAFRNLKRGVNLRLPSGPDVARKFCVSPVDIGDEEPASLWYYILKEAEKLPGGNAGQSLGRVGSIIVCSVFAGLLKGDPCSYFNLDPCWTPKDEPLLRDGEDNQDDPNWTLASVIRLSGLPVSANDF
ncbi:MAG: peroxidase family protein [Pseudomonadota bacterium]